MKELAISRELVTFVDDDVYEWASRYNWRPQKNSHTIYVVRGTYSRKTGRAVTNYLHREILKVPAGKMTNHIDGNGLNNQRSNLEIVTRTGNYVAFCTPRKNKTSQFRGVFFHKASRKWMARGAGSGCCYLGLFEDEVDAAEARDADVLLKHGPGAQLNFPKI